MVIIIDGAGATVSDEADEKLKFFTTENQTCSDKFQEATYISQMFFKKV